MLMILKIANQPKPSIKRRLLQFDDNHHGPMLNIGDTNQIVSFDAFKNLVHL